MYDSSFFRCIMHYTRRESGSLPSGKFLSLVRLLCTLTIALCLALPSVFAQEADDVQPNQPLFLQAEKLIGNVSTSGTFTRELIGNVVLTQGPVRVTCNRALHFVEQNRADLFGNVVLTQGNTTMKAAQGSYDGTLRQISGTGGVELFDGKSNLKARTGSYSTAVKIARFFSQVRVENDSLIISCDSLEYHRATQNSYARGMATVLGKFTSAFLQGDSLVNIPADGYTRISNYALHGQAMVSQIDTVLVEKSSKKSPTNPVESSNKESSKQEPSNKESSNKESLQKKAISKEISTPEKNVQEKRLDTLCITGNLLEAFRRDSNEIYLAQGDVQLTRRNLAGRADTGMYDKTLSRIRLVSTTSATPILWLDSTQLRGDSIIIQLREKRVERIIAYTNAFAATKNDTTHEERIDQLSGENIIIQLQRDTIRSICAEGKAFNLYFAQSDNDNGTKEPDGAVRNAADTVKVLFENGELDNIIWRGKVEGEYIPEHIAQKQLQTLRLKGFAWFTNRPYLWRGMTQGVVQGTVSNKAQKSPKTSVKPHSEKKSRTTSKPKGTSIER
jgi:lipopolysaccharide export system protein LptA